jgi:predicted GNAT superfamily acetyltransferase
MTESRRVLKLDEELTIRRAETIADYRSCQEAQRQAWGIRDEGYLIPVATMVGANLHGGLVLGAFLPSGAAVAMSFAFLGRIEQKTCLYSQVTGVVPAYQSRGLGYEIKLCQRDIARSEGIEQIVWAFDPLQSGNAHFNLARLGATAARFVENMYGERTDALNAGVCTDRLIAQWKTRGASPVVLCPRAVANLPRLVESAPVTSSGAGTVPNAPNSEPNPTAIGGARVLLEIPDDIAALRRERPAEAEAWRSVVNKAMRLALAHDYRAVGFVRDDSSGYRRGFYVLERLQ